MSQSSTAIAIAGGGPAGAMLAAELAGQGQAVFLYDEKLAWEKPCGGGVTSKALKQYPFLNTQECNWVRECELISPAGRRALLPLDRPVAIYARRRLNGLLLERAQQRGATLIQDRVVGVRPERGEWRLQLRRGRSVPAGRLAIAAGARSRLQASFVDPPAADDLMATAGYFIPARALPWAAERMVVRFLPGLEGYIWSFPRADHASIGICGRCGAQPTAELRRRLEDWLDASGIPDWRQAEFYAHLLPAPRLSAWQSARFEGECAGARWALVGDAAGLVDPITGEGLYYALRSAELLSQAWSEAGAGDNSYGDNSYTVRLQRDIGDELKAAAAISGRFYSGRFLGDSVLERMTQFTACSRQFRRLMCDLFAGSQDYRRLRHRLYRNLPGTALELALAAFDWRTGRQAM